MVSKLLGHGIAACLANPFNITGIVIKYENMSYKVAVHHAHLILGLYGKAIKYTRDLFDAPDVSSPARTFCPTTFTVSLLFPFPRCLFRTERGRINSYDHQELRNDHCPAWKLHVGGDAEQRQGGGNESGSGRDREKRRRTRKERSFLRAFHGREGKERDAVGGGWDWSKYLCGREQCVCKKSVKKKIVRTTWTFSPHYATVPSSRHQTAES